MSAFIEWVNGCIIEEEFFNTEMIDNLLVDKRYNDPFDRYRKYTKLGTEVKWVHVPFSEFTPEFKVHLLLLGVS